MSELPEACSGLMYTGVPMTWPISVKSVPPPKSELVALAMPKSMTLGTALPSS